MYHPLYGPIRNDIEASNEGQSPKPISIKINIPKAMNKNVKITVNLLGGVHPIFIHQFFFIFFLIKINI